MEQIIKELLKSKKDEDFIEHLFYAIHDMKMDTNLPLTVSADDKFSFLKEMYPNLKLEKFNKNNLFFTTDDHNSLLTFNFSFYSDSDSEPKDLNIGLKKDDDGILLKKLVEHKPLFPDSFCITDKIKHFKKFIEILSKEKVDREYPPIIDVYASPVIENMMRIKDYEAIQKYFKTIEIHGDHVTTVTNTKGRTLRIHFQERMASSMKNVMIDEKMYQTMVDVLSNFPDKIVWTSFTNVFYDSLKKYTYHDKVGEIHGYQLKKKMPLFTEKAKNKMDLIIKFGLILPEIREVISLLELKTSFENRKNKLELLLKK